MCLCKKTKSNYCKHIAIFIIFWLKDNKIVIIDKNSTIWRILMKKCMVIGSTVCDVTMYVNNLPDEQVDVHISKQIFNLGGCAYNAVSVIHNLGVPYTFISPIGTGFYGEFVRNELGKVGIKPTVELEQENGCCYCIVDEKGERIFLSHHGAEYTFSPKWLDNYNLDEYEYIYICGLEVEDVDGDKLVSVLNKFKGDIIFAPGPRIAYIDDKLLNKIYKVKPMIHLNKPELICMTDIEDLEKSVKKAFEICQNTVIVTLGEEGSLYYDGQNYEVVSGYKSEVLDTVGAGDSHIGAVMACLSKCKSMRDSLDFANLLSSKIVEISGVNLGKKEYDKLLEKFWE